MCNQRKGDSIEYPLKTEGWDKQLGSLHSGRSKIGKWSTGLMLTQNLDPTMKSGIESTAKLEFEEEFRAYTSVRDDIQTSFAANSFMQPGVIIVLRDYREVVGHVEGSSRNVQKTSCIESLKATSAIFGPLIIRVFR